MVDEIKKKYERYINKLLIKLKNLKGTPYAIAAGFACGVAISFTPLIGFHMILAAITAFLFRGSIIASALGTFFGNPWTFPVIWVMVLYTGEFLLGMESNTGNVNFLQVFKSSSEALYHLEFKNFGKDVWPILKPMLVGCVPYYIISWIASFVFIKKVVENLQLRKKKRMEKVG